MFWPIPQIYEPMALKISASIKVTDTSISDCRKQFGLSFKSVAFLCKVHRNYRTIFFAGFFRTVPLKMITFLAGEALEKTKRNLLLQFVHLVDQNRWWPFSLESGQIKANCLRQSATGIQSLDVCVWFSLVPGRLVHHLSTRRPPMRRTAKLSKLQNHYKKIINQAD